MEGRMVVEDEASAKAVYGEIGVSRHESGLIRAEVRAPGRCGSFAGTPAAWRGIMQQVQALLATPDGRGPGIFDQCAPDCFLFEGAATDGGQYAPDSYDPDLTADLDEPA